MVCSLQLSSLPPITVTVSHLIIGTRYDLPPIAAPLQREDSEVASLLHLLGLGLGVHIKTQRLVHLTQRSEAGEGGGALNPNRCCALGRACISSKHSASFT